MAYLPIHLCCFLYTYTCMPSKTVYVPDDAYKHAVATSTDGQSVGKRLQELIQKGVDMERGADE